MPSGSKKLRELSCVNIRTRCDPAAEYSDQPPIRAFSNRVTRCPPLWQSICYPPVRSNINAVGGRETFMILRGFAEKAIIAKMCKESETTKKGTLRGLRRCSGGAAMMPSKKWQGHIAR